MRIGIDARLFGPETGIGRYTENLIRNLELLDTKNEYVIFLSPAKFDAYRPANKNFTREIAKSRWYTFREQLEMPRLVNQARVDLMHFPHFNVPLLCSVPFVVSIHDLILLDFPTARATTLGPLLYWFKYKIGYPLIIKNALRRAKAVITMAEYTKERIKKSFNIPPEKISVIYEGVADSVRQTAYDAPPKKITKPFILYVGNAYPHKNLETLVDVFLDLRSSSPCDSQSEQAQDAKAGRGCDYQLVLVGKEDYFYNRLRDYIKSKNNPNTADIILYGFAPDAELAVLYKKAALYVFPSFMEGFGLPPLEAMAHGLPVVSSNASCLPEILGEAALYFDPRDKTAMLEAIKRGAADETLRAELRERGFCQIKKYSWRQCAEETLKIYNQAGL